MRGRAKTRYQRDPDFFFKNKLYGYGLNFETWEQMVAAQGNRCAICGTEGSTERRLDVDHCHETGRVRGLLCTLCNRGLGQFKDSVERMQAAITYLSGTKDWRDEWTSRKKAA